MFHNAGNITSDSIFPEPSVKDILDLTVDTSCSMKAEVFSEGMPPDVALEKELIGVCLKDFVVCFTRGTAGSEAEDIWYEFIEVEKPKDFIRIYLDPRKFIPLGYTLEEIAEKVYPDRLYNVSPDFMGIIDVVTSPGADITNVIHGFGTRLNGSFLIKDARIIDNKLYTIGSDLATIFKVDKIVHDTITSNSILDVEKVFGIAAARELITRLIDNKIVASFMTRSGKVLPFKKDNLLLYRRGFISSMSFERVRGSLVSEIKEAGEVTDDLSSIYSRIWAGAV
jgi:hypothetical protein